MNMLHAIGEALRMACVMAWQIFWGLSLGFLFSAVIEQIVSKDEMSRLLPDASPRSVAVASALGAASSSCSYAAVAMTRSMIRKGANFVACLAFQFAATNLVLELGLLLWALLGWQFAVSEFIGGAIMIVLIATVFRVLLSRKRIKEAVMQAQRNVAGSMEGHASMAMAAHKDSWRSRLFSRKGWTAISHGYVMNWAMLWKDIALGVLVAGALAAWVPDGFWRAFFLIDHPTLALFWGPVIGPLIAMATFTCSVGNVPFASVLWKGGISFGGVIAFIFGDLIIPPILNVYRKYYGAPMTWIMAMSFYLIMVIAALAVEGLFALFGWLPNGARYSIAQAGIIWNYTTILNIGFAILALALTAIFLQTGGPTMMREMASGSHPHEHHH